MEQTSQTCPWIAVSLGSQQRSTSLPFCVYPETTASFQSVSHLCIHCCLLPLPTLFVCFSTLFQPQISHSHRQMNHLQEGYKWERRGGDLWNSGRGLLMCKGSKTELLICYEKHVFGVNKEEFLWRWWCVAAVEEEWLESGVQHMFCYKSHHLQRAGAHSVQLQNINYSVMLNNYL